MVMRWVRLGTEKQRPSAAGCLCVVLLQPVTCDNISPVKAPGQVFTCPAFREFDPTKATAKGPSVDTCCSKVRRPAGPEPNPRV